MVTRLNVIISYMYECIHILHTFIVYINHFIQMSNHYAVHLKLT